jgi:hypothetical protein
MFDYGIKIAQDKKEIEQALRLRYEIFTPPFHKVGVGAEGERAGFAQQFP